jgi:hypothetical protein
MWDKRGLINLSALILNMAAYNFYFYELLFGDWNKAQAKALYYITTSCMMFYLIVDDIRGRDSNLHIELSIISKGAILINFILFALILKGVFNNPIIYLFLLNGSIFALSTIILISGIRHETFKN